MAAAALLPDYGQVLRSHSGALRRKSLDERLMQDRANIEIEAAKAEASQLRAEAEELQQALEDERQRQLERKARHEAEKADVAAQKREVNSRRLQVSALTDDFAKVKAEVEAHISKTLEKAREEALARELEMEACWRSQHLTHVEMLRMAESSIQEVEKELDALAVELRRHPKRAAGVQLCAALERLVHARKVTARGHALEKQNCDLDELRSRQLRERDEQLAQLDVDAAEQRRGAAEQRREEEEEAAREEQELRERIVRNTRRAERAERDAAAHLQAMRKEEDLSVINATRHSTQFLDKEAETAAASAVARCQLGRASAPLLPRVASADMRSAALHAEFPVVGTLKALDQEIRGREPRLGLLR